MANKRQVNGYSLIVKNGLKLFLFMLIFVLMSLPVLMIENAIGRFFLALVCMAPMVFLSVAFGRTAGQEAYKQIKKNTILTKNGEEISKQTKFAEFTPYKGFLTGLIIIVPQILILIISVLSKNFIMRAIIIFLNMPFFGIMLSLGFDSEVINASSLLLMVPAVVPGIIYGVFYVLGGLKMKFQHMEIQDELSRFDY